MDYAFKELLQAAIKYNQALFEDIREYNDPWFGMGRLACAREFRTIHLNVGRRAGKTRAIQELLDDTSVVVVQNTAHKRDLHGGNAKTVSEIKPTHGITRVYVDEYYDMRQEDIAKIYQCYALSPDVVFIFVGHPGYLIPGVRNCKMAF